MPKLSDIIALAPEARPAPLREIEVDVDAFTPPEGLREIALLYRGEGDEIDELLLDIVIGYALAGVDVTLEVPHEAEGIDAAYLLSVAANAGFSLSLLPPDPVTPEARDAYLARLTAFTQAYLQQANFGRYVLPITSHLEYLFAEALTGPLTLTPADAYTRAVFVEPLEPAFIDDLKGAIREATHRAFGGAEPFREFARAIAWKIFRQAEENALDLVRQREQSGQTAQTAPPPS